MALSNFTENVAIVSTLDDNPIETGQCADSAALKAKFDDGVGKVKTWINGTLIPFINKNAVQRTAVSVPAADWTSVTNGGYAEVEVPKAIYDDYTTSSYVIRPGIDTDETTANIMLNFKRTKGLLFFPYGRTHDNNVYSITVYCVGTVPTNDLYLEILRIPR